MISWKCIQFIVSIEGGFFDIEVDSPNIPIIVPTKA
jgi:hypothetical protein